jgi:anti-sigma factor ChrR (cupin superfamily)
MDWRTINHNSGFAEARQSMIDDSEQFTDEPSSNANHYCFPELAPLYALGLLSEVERQWVEQQVRDCPELAVELAQYETVLTAIPYAVEPLPSDAVMQDIKGKLFDRLDLPLVPTVSVEMTSEAEPASSLVPFMTVRSGEVQWRSGRVPKVEIAILHVDEVRRERVGLLRAEPGMEYPPHTHGGVEEIYMLSGDLRLEGIVYGPGDYIRSTSGSHHATSYSTDGCMFFFRASLDDVYPT